MQQATATPTRAVVFGGLMAALTIALAGPLGPVLPTVLALPIGLAYARYGWRVALGAALVATAVCLMLYDWYTVLVLVVPSGVLPGLALGWGVAGRRRAGPTIALATAANIAGYALDYYVGAVLLHRDPAQDWQRTVDAVLGRFGGGAPVPLTWTPQGLLAWLSSLPLRALAPVLRHGVLAGGVLTSLILAVSAYLIAYLVYPRLGHALPPLPPLQRWRLPWWAAAAFVAGLALSWAPAPYLAAAGGNVAFVLLVPLALQGFVAAIAVTRSLGLPPLPAFVVAMAVWWLSLGGLILGLIDAVVDLRGRARGWRQGTRR